LVTKLHVGGSNPVRELANFFLNPGVKQWKALERFAGYLKENNDDIKLTHRKPKELRIVSSVDSNYATDKGDCPSMSGGLHALGGMLTNWNCATQKSVTLSTVLQRQTTFIQNGTMNAWMNYSECVDTVPAAWRENVKIDESNESWVKVCHGSSKVKSSLRKAKCGNDGS
jgi:hypothetical protein